MSRRVSLPGADELFRTTGAAVAPVPISSPPVERLEPRSLPAAARAAERVHDRLRAVPDVAADEPAPPVRELARPRPVGKPRRGSGRTRHDEKITVYVSAQELLDLEHARLVLRAEYGIAVDRGRIVREAIAELLADLDAHGPDSLVVRRLRPR